EVQRCAARGHRGVLFTGEPQRFGLPMLGAPHWDPLYAVCQEAGLPLHFHIGGGADPKADKIAPERLDTVGRAASGSFTGLELNLKNAIQCADLILCGPLRRFPDLKFVSVESGTGWVPFLLEAADWHYLGATRPGRVPGVQQPGHVHTDDLLPSELF